MFCKWCGGKITSSDTKCGRCGREVPPLSDCGGFYDLVPGAKEGVKASPAAPAAEKQEKKVPVKTGADRQEPVRKPRVDAKLKNQLVMGAAAALALILILLLVISGRVNRNYRELQALKDSLAGAPVVESQNQASEPDAPDLKPEDTQPQTSGTENDVAQEDITLTFRLMDTEEGPWVEGTADLGEEKDTLVLNIQEREDVPHEAVRDWTQLVRFSLQSDLLAGCLEIRNEYGTQKGNVYMCFIPDKGDALTADSYQWQYRIGTGAWTEIIDGDDSDKFLLLDEGSHLKFDLAWIDRLLMDQTGQMELRCEMTFTDANGNTFTIVVEGIDFWMNNNV